MNKEPLSFAFLAENCIQCHACEVACITWRGLEHGVKWRRLTSGFVGSYPHTKLVAAAVSCLHCQEPACVAICPTQAITKREDGIVLVDQDKCVGCRACYGVCPVGAPQFGGNGLMQKCDLCADRLAPGEDSPCVKVCPTRALVRQYMTLEEKETQDAALIALVQRN